MAHRKHLEPGGSATNWDFRISLSSFAPAIFNCTGCTAKAYVQGTTSYGASYTISGFLQYLYATQDGTGVQSTDYTLDVPSLMSPYHLNLGASLVHDMMVVRLVNAEPTLVSCDAWSLVFDELQVWRGDPEAGGVEQLIGGDSILPASGGPYTLSGTGYDGLQNITTFAAYSEVVPLFSGGAAGCGPTDTSFYNHSTFIATCGWRWLDGASYHGEAITIVSPSSLGSCACSGALGGASGSDSWTVALSAGLAIDRTWVEGPLECEYCYIDIRTGLLVCITVSKDPAYTVSYVYNSQFVTISPQYTGAGITSTTYYQKVGCSASPTLVEPTDFVYDGPTTVVESETKSPYELYTRIFRDDEYCGDAPPYDIVCLPPVNCSYSRTWSVSWSIDPGCNGYHGPHNFVTSSSEFMCAMIDVFDDVWVQRSRFALPEGANMTRVKVTTSQDCSYARLTEWIQGRQVMVFYQRGATGVYYRTSTNSGVSWSSETAMSMFAGAPRQPFPFTDDQGALYVFAFKYDAGTSGPGKIYYVRKGTGDLTFSAEATIKDTTNTALSVADTGFAVTMPPEGARRPVLSLNIQGEADVSHWASHNDAANWQRGT